MEPLEANETRRRSDPAGAAMASLLVVQGEHARTIVLEDEVLFGRAPNCTVQLADESVSRHHARILFNDGTWAIHDLSSHNGTFVNKRRIASPARLHPGDVLGIGNAIVVVQGLGAHARFDRTVPWGRFEGSLDEALAVALRTGAQVAVASFQLEHPTAPQSVVLRALAQGLQVGELGSAASDTDFAALLSEAMDPLAAAGRALATLAQFDVDARCGLAHFPRDGTSAEVLLIAARQAAQRAEHGQLAEHADASELTLGTRRLVVADPATRSVYALLSRLAPSLVNVLVTGETGVGKENAAFALHHHSRRSAGPFVVLNCAAIADALAESFLFGHERGAFTGAVSAHAGVFEAAHGGTLFLDEVGELSAAVQAKLLRVLETRAVTRVGSTKSIEVDVRVVAATHRDLEEDVASGRFRKDLFFRLAAAVVTLPPLRIRPVEIAVLSQFFLEQACAREGHAAMELSAEAMDALQRHPWPGNVRELKNTLEVIVASSGARVIEREHLPLRLQGLIGLDASEKPRGPGAVLGTRKPLVQELNELETLRIVQALRDAGGSQVDAAQALGMPRRTLVFKVRRLRAQGLLPKDL